MNETAMYVDHILRNTKAFNQRTGQFLFNCLPEGPAVAVRGKLWDPFYKDLNPYELVEWIENHLVFRNNEIIAVFDKNTFIWPAN